VSAVILAGLAASNASAEASAAGNTAAATAASSAAVAAFSVAVSCGQNECSYVGSDKSNIVITESIACRVCLSSHLSVWRCVSASPIACILKQRLR